MDIKFSDNKDKVLLLPLVSVIIPTYNRASFIKNAIESVLAQSFKNFEIIVIDDGSSDNTMDIVSQITDPRLIYHYQENKGRSNARNHALGIAKGKYITFLDSDDIYLPNKLKLQVEYLDACPDLNMVYTSAHCIDEAGEITSHEYVASISGWIYDKIAFFIPVTITLPTVMVRREVFDKVGRFDENLHRFEDTDMWRRISKFYQIGAMPEFTCKLRTHTDNSLINQDPETIKNALRYYANKILKEDKEFDIRLRKRGVAKIYRYYGYYLCQIPQFHKNGQEFFKIADKFDKLNKNMLILKAFCYRCFAVISRAYYKWLNVMYRVYAFFKKKIKSKK